MQTTTPLAVLMLVALALRVVVAQPASLASLATSLDVDGSSVTVSGISSGGYMAQQFHVAYSGRIAGVGIIAGGPYRCAEGRYPPWSWFDWSGLHAATSVCTDVNPYAFYSGPPDLDISLRETRRAAAAGQVDDLEHLRGDRIWLLSGGNDDTVPGAVMDVLQDYYLVFVDAADVVRVHLAGAGHGMITDDFGNACGTSESPYLNDCDFDAAGTMLEHLLGDLTAPTPRNRHRDVLAFDQTAFFDRGDPSVSLHDVGHLYVPESCAAGAACRLHVAFHGCRQYEELVGDAFYADAGYNEWAESNDLVVLYPQTTAWSGGFFGGTDRNPRGCWDWWGYSGSRYHTREGKQIRAVNAMIDALVGSGR